MPDASPTKWHLAHTSWFFEAFVLGPAGVPPLDPAYGRLFNSYYEALGERHARPERGLLSRPTLAEVARYRAHVDAHMTDRIAAIAREGDAAAAAIVELGLNHEQQHQELILTDALHALSRNPLAPAYRAGKTPTAATTAPSEARWIGFDEGLVRIGHAGGSFAFDNEE